MTTTSPDASSSSPLVVSERDMLGAMMILQRSADDPDVLMTLSDEEILSLEGLDALRALGSPYLDQEQIHRETAGATAMRGLIARRLVNPTDQGREDEGALLIGEGDPAERLIQLEIGMAGILTLRRIPEAMVVIDRVASQVRTRLGLYFFPDGVLEEFVAADGFHHFCAPTRAALPARLAEFVDPFGAASADGEIEEITVADVDELHGLEDTRGLATITSIGDGAPRRATVFTMSDRIRLVDNGNEDPAQLAPDALLAICEVSGDTLQEIIASLLPQPDETDTEG